MSWITNLFSKGDSNLVDSVSGLLRNIVTTKSEKMQLDNEIRKACFIQMADQNVLKVCNPWVFSSQTVFV